MGEALSEPAHAGGGESRSGRSSNSKISARAKPSSGSGKRALRARNSQIATLRSKTEFNFEEEIRRCRTHRGWEQPACLDRYATRFGSLLIGAVKAVESRRSSQRFFHSAPSSGAGEGFAGEAEDVTFDGSKWGSPNSAAGRCPNREDHEVLLQDTLWNSLHRLRLIRSELKRMIEACNGGSVAHCRILEALST